MAEDWDLSAVVRGCRSSLLASATTTCSSKDPPLSLMKQENEAFSFPNLIQPTTNGFQELHQFFKPFIPTTNKTTTISTSDFALARSSNSSDNKSININNININASSSASAATISYASRNIRHLSASELQRFHDQHVQQLEKQMQIQDQLQLAHQKPQFQIPQQGQIGVGGSSNNNPAMTSTLPNTQQANQPTTRSRKRKSQQKRMVCHVTAENLTSDSWAWRKYGQKPIKGSPYPRNYYRCSSSKGCGARKQVERSNTEPNMFIVTYTGDHTHPRPTHRNSLAGSSRKTLSTLNRQMSSKESMGSPRATVNLSPTTPLTVVANDVKSGDEPIASSPFPEDDDVDLASHDDDDDDDDDDILIPNMAAMVDKFLLGGSDGDANRIGGACPNTEPG